MLTKMISEG